MSFVSNSASLPSNFNTCLAATFDVKLYGRIHSFIGWEILYTKAGLRIKQNRYAKKIIMRFGFGRRNEVHTRLH